MTRVKLDKGAQRKFLEDVAEFSGLQWAEISKISNICGRSLRDWRREKYNMSHEALLKLHEISGVAAPEIKEILPEYWSTAKASRLGAIRHNELYGNPATAEGRSKGGINTIKKFRSDPEFARMIGFKLRKSINLPKYSLDLAEFIGIMLGDGFIKSNKNQLGVAFNIETDYNYAKYVQVLIKALFNLDSSICRENNSKGATVLVSSRNLVDFLISVGLKPGNKVLNQVDIPEWVNSKQEFRIACLKGLVDTDGSFYSYKHKVSNRIYCNFAMCFTNNSKPLVRAVYGILKSLGFRPLINSRNVYLHRKKELRKYFKEIGPSNPKHLDKFNNYSLTEAEVVLAH